MDSMELIKNTGILKMIKEYERACLGENPGAAIGKIGTMALVMILIIGVCNCFFGYRLMKLWLLLLGVLLGGTLGYVLSQGFTENRLLSTVIAVAAAAVCGGLSFWIYQAGVFLLCCIGGTLVFSFLFRPTTSLFFFICILLGVAIGFAGVKFVKPIVICVTSILGGLTMSAVIVRLMGLKEIYPGIFLGIILAAVGFAFQWLTNRTKRGEEEEVQERKEEKIQGEQKAQREYKEQKEDREQEKEQK